MTEASINVEDVNANTKIAHLQGQLDESNIDEKIKEVYANIEKVPKGLQLLFDFTSLDYMNSKSIGYLTDIYGKVTEGGGRVIIAGAKPNIADILQVVGLTQIIETVGTIEEAKSKLANAPAPAPTSTPSQAATQTPPAQETAPKAPVAAPTQAPVSTPTQPPVTPSPQPVPQTSTPAQTPTSAPTPATPAPATPTPATEAPVAPAVTPPTPQTPSADEGTYKFEQQ
ncbi:STAS domain-containing protein [Candidatus Peregrinibacteria bacterium]|nr:STAS domain-containing protein [Candidatus Peregrinibacteria bacterium]